MPDRPAELPSEIREFSDPTTGVAVRQLTNYKGHSHHLYFTNPGWWDGGRQLLIGSDRGNRTNLYSIHLETGVQTQLTDTDVPASDSLLNTAVNPLRDEAYAWLGGVLTAINLRTAGHRALYSKPPNFAGEMINVTADGQFACFSLMAFTGDDPRLGLLTGYQGMQQIFDSRPLCRVMRVHTTTGQAETLHEDRAWIGHVNTSPTQPNLLSFCHEGPWSQVKQRIWALDASTHRVWPVRPQQPGEAIGHEYWLQDGKRIGYHGHTAHLGRASAVYGIATVDHSHIDERFPHDSQHFHSNDEHLIIGDGAHGSPFVLLWQRQADGYSPARKLCTHRGSRHIQQLHIHPRFSPDGSYAIFTADPQGYGQVCSVSIPPFESLPLA